MERTLDVENGIRKIPRARNQKVFPSARYRSRYNLVQVAISKSEGSKALYLIGTLLVCGVALIIILVTMLVLKYRAKPVEWCTSKICKQTATRTLKYINTSINPCDNFYKFSCDGWLKQHSHPSHLLDWNVYVKQMEESNDAITDLLKNPINSEDSVGIAIAKQHFQKCMASDTINNGLERNKTLQFIISKTSEYGGWPILYEKNKWKSDGFDWMKSVVALQRELDKPTLLDVYAYQNPDGNTSMNIILLGKPSSKEVFKKYWDPLKSFRIELACIDFIVNVSRDLMQYSGISNIDMVHLENQALSIIKVDNALKRIDETTWRLPGHFLKPSGTVGTFQQFFEHLPCHRNCRFNNGGFFRLMNLFFNFSGIQIQSSQNIFIPDRNYFVNLNRILSLVSDEELANYLHFAMVFKLVTEGSPEIFQEYLDQLTSVQRGFNPYKTTRSFFCTNSAQRLVGYSVGQAYLQKQTNSSHKSTKSSKVQDLFERVRNSFQTLLKTSALPQSKKRVLLQVLQHTNICTIHETEKQQITLPNVLYSSESFLEETVILNAWAADVHLRNLGKPALADGCTWDQFLGHVGPHNKMLNVYIPPQDLQLPLYHDELPKAFRYGGLGSLLGHEISHSLALAGWMEISGNRKTNAAKCIKKQYDNFLVWLEDGGIGTLDGELTLEENLADSAGLIAAYKAFVQDQGGKKEIRVKGLEQFSNDQLFYIAFAQSWCGGYTPEGLSEHLAKDSHSPAPYRVLGAVANSKHFSKAWNCPVNPKMGSRTESNRQCKVF